MNKYYLKINRSEKIYVLFVNTIFLAFIYYFWPEFKGLLFPIIILGFLLLFNTYTYLISRSFVSLNNNTKEIEFNFRYLLGKRKQSVKLSEIKNIYINKDKNKNIKGVLAYDKFIFGMPGYDFTKKGLKVEFKNKVKIDYPILFNPAILIIWQRSYDEGYIFVKNFGLLLEEINKLK